MVLLASPQELENHSHKVLFMKIKKNQVSLLNKLKKKKDKLKILNEKFQALKQFANTKHLCKGKERLRRLHLKMPKSFENLIMDYISTPI